MDAFTNCENTIVPLIVLAKAANILGSTQIDQLKFCNKPWYSKGISLYELAQICNKEKNLQDANEYFGQARDSFQQAIEKDPHDAGSI